MQNGREERGGGAKWATVKLGAGYFDGGSRVAACSNLDTQPGAKTFWGPGGVVVVVGGGEGAGGGGVPGGMNGGGGGGGLHHPYLLGGPHRGDRSNWFQLSIQCTTLESANVS